jgi:hypothetical protein
VIPDASTLIGPTGDTTDNAPTYSWNAAVGSTWYYLWVDGPSGNVFKTWHTATSAGWASGGTCSVTPGTGLAAGAHQWWVRTWNSAGNGPYSSRGDFSVVSSTPPLATTLVSPMGNTVTADNTPTYSWNAVNGSTWYYLWVYGPTLDAYVIQQWFTATQAGCASGTGTCSVTPTTALFSGEHDWWIRTWNAAGNGPWSSRGDFSVATSVPAAPTLISPTGGASTSSSNPTYTWNAVSGATWYYIWVDGPSGHEFTQWVTASQAGCASGTGTCSFAPTQSLTETGAHKWWVKGWNPTGHGPYSARGDFTRTAFDDQKDDD